jgi:hypothetical protein
MAARIDLILRVEEIDTSPSLALRAGIRSTRAG